MHISLAKLLFGIGFLAITCGVVIGFVVVLGINAHARARTPNKYWKTASERYKGLIITYFVLMVVAIGVMIASGVVGKQ